jgi:hypothetical protein
MKALSVQQPWAQLIANGEKSLEVRIRRTHYRGPLVICASGRPAPLHVAELYSLSMLRAKAPRGCTICIVDLVDCIEGKPEHAAHTGGVDPTGQWCWVLKNPRALEQRPVKGWLGIFDIDPKLVRLK